MEYDGHDYTLKSGRKFAANNGIVGIAPDLDVREGYDGGVQFFDSWDFDCAPGEELKEINPWTAEDYAELADAMIALWQAFKEKHAE